MRIIQKVVSAALAFCLVCALCACGGKSGGLNARFNKLYLTEFPTEYLEDNEMYADEIESFHLEDFNGTFHEFQKFKTYSVEISITNGNDYAVDVFDIQMPQKSVGKNGVYFSTLDDGATLGIPANSASEQTVYYMVVANADLSEDEVLQTLGKMHITCLFADASAGIDMSDPNMDPADLQALQQSEIRYTK